MVAPGLAGLETVLTLHDAARIGHPDARWGVIEGNPVHDDVRAIAAATGVDFALDVILDGEQRDRAGVRRPARRRAPRRRAPWRSGRRCAPCRSAFDVVVTTNSGFPLDQNLYQAVKGMSAAAQVVKPGRDDRLRGRVPRRLPRPRLVPRGADVRGLAAARCSMRSPRASRRSPTSGRSRCRRRSRSAARVVMHTSYLSDDDLAAAHLEQTGDIGASVEEALEQAGGDARVCVLPEGPQTIPYVA